MIEFDPAKDAANITKHGISLRRAAELDIDRAIVVPDKRRDYGEDRLMEFGMIDGRLFALSFTDRQGTIRAISLRRSNLDELRRWQKK